MWTARVSKDHRNALWHSCLLLRVFLSASACQGCTQKHPLFKIRCKTRLFLCPQSLLGEQRASFQPMPLALPPSPDLAPDCQGLSLQGKEKERNRVTKDIFREQQDNPASMPQPELNLPSYSSLGQSPAIHFHLQSPYTYSAALPLGMVGQVVSLWAKDVTESIRFQ